MAALRTDVKSRQCCYVVSQGMMNLRKSEADHLLDSNQLRSYMPSCGGCAIYDEIAKH